MEYEGSWTQKNQMGTEPVPTRGFYCSDYFEQEKEVFRKSWIWACKETDIPNPGDYLVDDLPALSSSVIFVRGKDLKIRAFHNICRHRGNLLLWDTEGSCRMMSCKYHGWSFDLEGKLRGINDPENFFDVDKSKWGLLPVALETWAGLVFYNLDPNPQQSLKEYLGGLYDQYRDFPTGDFPQTYEWVTLLECNYKIVRDAFSEMYHTTVVHRRSAGETVIAKGGKFGRCHPVYAKAYANAGVFSSWGGPPSTLMALQEKVAKLGGADARSRGSEPLPGLNPGGSDSWGSDITHIFPSSSIIFFPDLMFFHKFKPVSVDRTQWHFFVCYRKPTKPSERFTQEYGKIHVRDAVLEDMGTVERTHRALKSRSLSHIQLADQELLVRAGHDWTQQQAGPYEDGPRAGGGGGS